MGLNDRPVKKRKTSNEVQRKSAQKPPKAPNSASGVGITKSRKATRKKRLPNPALLARSSVPSDLKTAVNGDRRLVVVAGSYDRVLYGLQTEPHKQSGQDNQSFEPIFIFPAHISCVKSVAASPQGGKWLATGGTDETIKVWDLRRKKELGSLQQHQG
jgi:protein MAK11